MDKFIVKSNITTSNKLYQWCIISNPTYLIRKWRTWRYIALLPHQSKSVLITDFNLWHLVSYLFGWLKMMYILPIFIFSTFYYFPVPFLKKLFANKCWKKNFVSTASGALVVGGVRDICIEYRWIDPGDRFECSMEYNQSVSGSPW